MNLKKKNAMKEIERKWFIKVLPKDLALYPNKELVAGYFEDEDGKDMRIRQEGDKYFKVKKSGQGIARDIGPIGDEEITKEEFNSLWSKTDGRRLWKTRYYIPYGEYTVELDIYRDFPGLYTAEIEFKTTVKDAKKFVPPDWFGQDITGVTRYSSNSLATYGLWGKDGEILDLESGIQEAVISIQILSKIPVIVLVAGGSASGTTSAVADK